MGPVTDTHRVTYRENVIMAVQEKKAQFDNAFMFDPSLNGEIMQMVDILGAMEAIIDGPRGGDTPDVEASHEPVCCVPRHIEWGKLIEKEDQIKALTDYKSPYVKAGASTLVRGRNVIMAAALFGVRIIGKQGATSNSAWAGQTVAVTVGSSDSATDVGMNVAKRLDGFMHFENSDIDLDEEEVHLALDPTENRQLYDDIIFVSKDYRDKAVIEEKRVKSILGIPIHTTKRVANTASTSTAALWCKSGMAWGRFAPLDVRSAPNPAKKFREQCYMEEWLGATRLEDEKVVKILNKIPS